MNRKKIYAIFFLSILVKIWLVFVLNIDHKPEVFEYETIANNILKGNGFLITDDSGIPYRAYVQPFYPIFVAVVYYLTNHSYFALAIIQSIVSSALCFMIYSISKSFLKNRGALLAALLTAFHPALTVYSTLKLHPLVLDTFFYFLTICLIFKFTESPNYKNALLSGIVMGLALLSRFTILPFIIFSMIYMFFIQKEGNIKTRMKYVFIICILIATTYSPWVIRNYKIFHKFVFMQTCSGENLWSGNNPLASGSEMLISGGSVHETMPKQMCKELSQLDELSQVEYYHNYFLSFVKEYPVLFLRLFIKKLYYFWWFAPHTGILYPKSWLYIYKLYYGIMCIFFMAGVYSLLKKKVKHSFMLLLFVYMLSISLVHALVNVDIRHRWTIEPVILIFATAGFFNIIAYLKAFFKKC